MHNKNKSTDNCKANKKMRILIRKGATVRLAKASTKIKIYKFTEHIIRKYGYIGEKHNEGQLNVVTRTIVRNVGLLYQKKR